jgi:hypothetical protein
MAVMMRPRFPIFALVAISFSTILAHRHLLTVSAAAETNTNGSLRTPVLIELFTSEGCSDCPPADALLERLDQFQPVRNADLIVLSEHVDYWDDIGWKDPYSSHEFSIRQGDYARRFRLGSPYTPQMVVDGDVELVGSDERRAIRVIENSIKVAKLPVVLSSIHREGNNKIAVHVEAGPLVASGRRAPAQVLIALADNSDQSSVRGGENSGRILKHVAVVRNLIQAGTIDNGGTFSKDVALSTGNADQRNLRIIAIVQESGLGRVLGVGSARLSN